MKLWNDTLMQGIQVDEYLRNRMAYQIDNGVLDFLAKNRTGG